MSPEDERLVADLDEAKSRLRASLKACRKILDSYRPTLGADPAAASDEPPLFEWPAAEGETPPERDD